jgi:hypothetical protein
VQILDPYARPGTYRKAQLHVHTTRSDGRSQPCDLARRYRDAGYTFVCFTDHDTVTRCDEVSDRSFLALPGVEETVALGILPLGRHLGRLLVDGILGSGSAEERIRRTLAAGGVPCLNHPSWPGNLWTGTWPLRVMQRMPGPLLVEIWNPHSNSDEDARRWTLAARTHGMAAPLVAIATDDYHVDGQFNRAWVMVKVTELSAEALRTALLSGALYASTGVAADFGVEAGAVVGRAHADDMLVIDAAGTIRARIVGDVVRYVPVGDEEFVRIECRAGVGRAWSQAFWITR